MYHWYSQNYTVWGYNNVIVLNIEYFLSIPRENGQWLRFKNTQKYSLLMSPPDEMNQEFLATCTICIIYQLTVE